MDDEASQVTMPPVISVQHVYKQFTLHRQRISLRHELLSIVRGKSHSTATPTRDAFWALEDVSFSVDAGESVAIVGRNGAGKTTLLRILTNIMQPTKGQVDVRGRYASLIGLGVGFDPDRTGRENIYLSAAIQGRAPRDVRHYIDEIIDFAELQEFIDVPIKLYSTGMIARLGFSTATHILPDIIFLDEALSVGDTAFQQKCIARMETLADTGRTLIFVSHSVAHISALCKRCIWLHHGKILMDDATDVVQDAYRTKFMASEPEVISSPADAG